MYFPEKILRKLPYFYCNRHVSPQVLNLKIDKVTVVRIRSYRMAAPDFLLGTRVSKFSTRVAKFSYYFCFLLARLIKATVVLSTRVTKFSTKLRIRVTKFSTRVTKFSM
jgi:hypothetical protein